MVIKTLKKVKNSKYLQPIAKFRNFVTKLYSPPPTLDHLLSIRLYEIMQVLPYIKKQAKILEIGAGSGFQAKVLSEHGFQVEAVDIQKSQYEFYPVKLYNGQNLPYQDRSFDIVFSSHALEHIRDIQRSLREIKRVLKDDGLAIHILATPYWLFWTNLTVILKLWRPMWTHGKHARTPIDEFYYFSKKYWIKIFTTNGFRVVKVFESGIFYTGASFFGKRLSIEHRKRLSKFLGSVSRVYILAKNKT